MSEPHEIVVVIRAETQGDREAIRSVHRLAFSNEAEPNLVDALRQSGDAVFSLVAELEGTIIGHILFSRLDAPVRALALAPVGVLPDHQRQGVGSMLIRAGLREAQRHGWVAVFVLGEPEYYSRFGFDLEAARAYQCPYAGDYFMARFLAATELRSGVIAYPTPFSALG